MEKIKISIITNDKSLYKNIRYILNELKIFKVDCVDNIKKCIDYYDIIMIDMDSFAQENQGAIFKVVKKLSNHNNIILLRNMDINKVGLKKINIVTKPITETKLINSMYDVMLDNLCKTLDKLDLGYSCNKHLMGV